MKTPSQLARQLRVRHALRSHSLYPRLVVSRSHAHLQAQIIDRQTGEVLAAAHDLHLKQGTKTEKAAAVGAALASVALKAGVKQVVFDRGPYRFHGRIKALAEAVKAGGLKL